LTKKKKKLLKISIYNDGSKYLKKLKSPYKKKLKKKSNYKTAGYKITAKRSGYENPIIALGGCS
jgi:hypothetical protein